MAKARSDAVPLTGDPLIDGLTQSSRWATGSSHTLTYAFHDDLRYGPWTKAEIAGVRGALQAWASVADLRFQQVSTAGGYPRSAADIALLLTGDTLQQGLGAIGLGFFPDPPLVDALLREEGLTRADFRNLEGDIWLDNYNVVFDFMRPGGHGRLVVLHEIGHALGLKHPFDDGGRGRPTFQELGIAGLDDNRWTVMSYATASGLLAAGHPATPMPLDILAIQHVYGPNMAFHAGNDTYLLKSDNALRTIWDAGGTDTLSAAGLGFGVTLDLHEAAFNRHGQHSTTAIAFGVTIERAVGSPFDDILIGNDAANRLDGGRGADRMIGGPGNDTYIVDRRGDVVEEGSDGGTDAVRSPISLALADNVERLTLLGSKAIGGRGNGLDNILVGNAGANRLFGGGGNDRLDGGLGVDSLFGGDGDDFLIVDSMRETVDGGPGHDKLVSRVGYDLARAAPAGVEELRLNGKKAKAGYGDAGDNVLIGSSADNTLSGRGGEDRLQGGLGADRLLGGPDSDTFVWQSRDERKDQITDLELGPGGDVMNVSAALRGYDPALDDPTDWVATSLTRTTLTLSIDPDGPGGALTFTALATAELPAVVPVDVATLIADGNLFLG